MRFFPEKNYYITFPFLLFTFRKCFIFLFINKNLTYLSFFSEFLPERYINILLLAFQEMIYELELIFKKQFESILDEKCWNKK